MFLWCDLSLLDISFCLSFFLSLPLLSNIWKANLILTFIKIIISAISIHLHKLDVNLVYLMGFHHVVFGENPICESGIFLWYKALRSHMLIHSHSHSLASTNRIIFLPLPPTLTFGLFYFIQIPHTHTDIHNNISLIFVRFHSKNHKNLSIITKHIAMIECRFFFFSSSYWIHPKIYIFLCLFGSFHPDCFA